VIKVTTPFSEDAPVYVISVAAQLSGLHPQTLRTYDRMGLVCPGRSAGRGRRYSMRDIAMLREIQRLSQSEGVNLAGIKQILELQREVIRLRDEISQLRGAVEELSGELESTRAVAARLAQLRHGPQGQSETTDLVPIRQSSIVLWQSRTRDDGPSA
jgi:MerR family transcriptional regulator/heat shock protein HspR